MKTLNFNNVNFSYKNGTPIFKDLNLTLNADKGHVVALMGASGSGKSTIFKLILNNEKPNKGKIEFNIPDPIIAYLPQEPVLFEHLSPMQNARYFQRSSHYKKHFNEPLFFDLIKSLNILDVLEESKSVLELSGGQRQKLSLLRALSIQPDILLLDEPTTGLDANVKLQFLNKLREIVLKYGLMVIYITHHKLETEMIADEIVYLSTNNGTGSTIYRNDILNFIKQPPILEALEVFSYPKPNILLGKIQNNIFVPIDEKSSSNIFYLGLTEDKIIFSNAGLEYDIIASNAINTIIRFKGSEQQINLSTEKIPTDKTSHITFEGTFNTYKLNGEFLNTLTI